jgi:prepilin-type N-terminal cleavage/methylation domain-containing protein
MHVASQAGFSLIEMLIAVALITVLGSMALFQIGSVRPSLKADGAMRVVMGELITARESAIAQRRLMQIEFVGTSAIRITRVEVPTGTTVLREVIFEGNVQYGLVAGVADTPDAFGNSEATDFGSAVSIMFGTDGALIDSTGTPVNGTIFLTIPDTPQSVRAVTVLGSTGRVRAFRWDGDNWQGV